MSFEDAYDDEVGLLYRKFMPKVYGFLCGLGCDRGLAEEITTDAFMAARRQWAKVRAYDQPEYYVFKVASHERCRRQKKHDDHAGDLYPEPQRAARGPSDDLAQRVADRAAIRHALQQLPSSQREAVLLRHYVGLPEATTAAIMKISVGAVKSYASKGRQRLRDLLGEFRAGEGGTDEFG